MTDKTKFEQFREAALADFNSYYDDPKTLRAVEIANMMEEFWRLQTRMSGLTLIHYFGEQLGEHLWIKFVGEHNRNIITWLGSLTGEYKFYILYLLRNDEYFFFH